MQKPCGNGAIDTGETCDDGNTTNGDGCSSKCKIEKNWSCGNRSLSVKSECRKCGDGKVDGNPFTEECDDGNNKNGDGCSSTCKIEKRR